MTLQQHRRNATERLASHKLFKTRSNAKRKALGAVLGCGGHQTVLARRMGRLEWVSRQKSKLISETLCTVGISAGHA
jgi:hypothetical protein